MSPIDLSHSHGAATRRVRAVFDATTITVYQAYAPAIGEPAAEHGTLRDTRFRLDRITWIKPSFLWMMHRSAWATRAGQERILSIRMTRKGFEEALSLGTLADFDPGVHADHMDWRRRLDRSTVRIQWDPERDLELRPQTRRSLQVGLRGENVEHFAHRWIVGIDDVTDLAKQVRDDVRSGRLDDARDRLPVEREYDLPQATAAWIGADA